jgi:septal ring factor EnvC (AmiA/AmiB activator)
MPLHMGSERPGSVMATDSTIPEELQALLTQLESARSELAEALKTDQEELPQRTKERAAKTEEFRRNYSEREKRHPSYEEFYPVLPRNS